MAKYQIEAYTGTENYIFVSYAHKDSDKVYPILKKLNRRGYRVWYDEGIAPGSEWSENIALHLNKCAIVLAFVTPNFMASVNCRREINFALSKQKPFLSVVLEPTEMPLGMELQLSAQQSVLRYNYATEEQFIEKICACPEMDNCVGNAPATQEADSVLMPNQKEESAEEQQSAELSRDQSQPDIKAAVSRYGSLVASVAAAVSAVLLIIVMLLLFANYHQDNLLRYTTLGSFPDGIAKILPKVWHELPPITSAAYKKLGNLPAIGWIIALAWFLRSVGDHFKRHAVADKMMQITVAARCLVIIAHVIMCAKVEKAAQLTAPQWENWLPYYFPIENIVAFIVMIVLGYVTGRIVNWLVRTILRMVLKTEL